MIPMHMGKDLAEQHVIDLRRMGTATPRDRTRERAWRWRDSWRLRRQPGRIRRRVLARWDRPLAPAGEAGLTGAGHAQLPCPR